MSVFVFYSPDHPADRPIVYHFHDSILTEYALEESADHARICIHEIDSVSLYKALEMSSSDGDDFLNLLESLAQTDVIFGSDPEFLDAITSYLELALSSDAKHLSMEDMTNGAFQIMVKGELLHDHMQHMTDEEKND